MEFLKGLEGIKGSVILKETKWSNYSFDGFRKLGEA